MRISQMCSSERPREKLLSRGAEALGDGELLAILLRTGSPGESALDLAQRLLGLVGGKLSGLFECSPDYLAGLPGVGPARAASLVAAFEIGRRFMQEFPDPGTMISKSQQIHALLHPRLKGLKHEECWEVLLDRNHRFIKMMKVSVGSSRGTSFDVSAIVRNGLENNAWGIIIAHNHPSGSPRPSPTDIKVTNTLKAACLSCSMNFLDHLIISDQHYYSFCDEKMY